MNRYMGGFIMKSGDGRFYMMMMTRGTTNHSKLKQAHQQSTLFIAALVYLLLACSRTAVCNAQQQQLQPAAAICKFPTKSPVASFNNSTAAEWQLRAPQCSELIDGIILNWGISGQQANAVITFVIRAQLPAGTSMFGIGLSDLGSMKGADIFLFRAQGKGPIWTLTDAHAMGFQQPTADKQQDLTLLGVHYGNNTLTAAWQRYVTPCDNQDIPIPATTPLFLMWAYAPTFSYHGSNRGSRQVHFYPVANKFAEGISAVATPQPEDLQVMDLTFPVAISSSQQNYYVYHYFELPKDSKYQIVRFETVKGSNLLHHGIAYSCEESAAADVTRLASKGPFSGFETNRLCHKVYMILRGVTAVGNHAHDGVWVAPPDIGLPMGTADNRVMAIELHYNNPQLLAGQTDPGSGLRIYYTSKLRKHDIAVLAMSQPLLEIPPGKASVSAVPTVCPSQCTSKRLNQPITLMYGAFHMHGLGKSGIVRRFRGSKELPPLDQLHAFDYDFHDSRPLINQTLLPGDALTLQCTFDSTGRANRTAWGPGTLDEMCMYYIWYYPAQNGFGLCSSFGTQARAACDAGPAPELVTMLYNKTSSAVLLRKILEFTVRGKMTTVPGKNPATSPFQQACKQKL